MNRKRISFEFKIEDDVPIPPEFTSPGSGKSPFRMALEQMEIGQSVVVPRRVATAGHMWTVKRVTGRKFTMRKVDNDTARVWRIA